MRPMKLAIALMAAPMIVASAGCAAWFHNERDGEAAAEGQARASARLPEPTRITLPNGMTLLCVYRPNLPIVSINVVLRAGAVVDPQDKAGLADLTASLLKRGTTTRTAPQIAEAIDSVGGSLTTAAGTDTAAAGVTVLTKDVDLGVGLLADVLQHPAFDKKELERLKEEASASLKSSLDDANEVVRMALHQRVLAGNPYGGHETLRSVAGIDTADVRKFYETYYHPNNAIVAVVGDLTPDQAREKLGAAFAGWRQASVPTASVPAPAPVSGRHVYLVDMDVNQSFVMLGHPAVKRNTPDYFALTVLNFILGGDFTSRLNMSIRDRQGLAYGAGSAFRMYREAGYFLASLNTRTATTAKAIESLLAELKGIQEGEVTNQELSTAKAFLTGSFPLRFETNQQLASEVVNIEVYGLPSDYLATYRERILGVTAADVQRVARTYLRPGDYDLVVVTKARDVGGALAAFGQVENLPKEGLIQ